MSLFKKWSEIPDIDKIFLILMLSIITIFTLDIFVLKFSNNLFIYPITLMIISIVRLLINSIKEEK